MRCAFKYKLKPTKDQAATLGQWIELCRRQYNYRLGERFEWYEATRSPANACSLIQGPQPSIEQVFRNIPEYKVTTRDGRKDPKNPNKAVSLKGTKVDLIKGGFVNWATVQKDDLPNTKKLFPEYKEMPAQMLQDVIERVNKAFDRFTKGDSKGKRSGKPKFKGRPYFKSVCFPQGVEILSKGVVNLPKIGDIEFIQHRPIPKGFTVKTAIVSRECDGYFLVLTLEDKTISAVPDVEIHPTEENSKGIDLGLEFYSSDSDGVQHEFPRWFRKHEAKLARLQAKQSKAKKGSAARKIYAIRVARLHKKIAASRLDWQYKLAYKLFEDCDVLFIEDLSLRNLIRKNKLKTDEHGKITTNGQAAKSGLNKSMTDAALGQFAQVLKWVARKTGKRVIEVDPRGTSQHCFDCLNKVPKTLSDRWHSCQCGVEIPRDVNSGKLIKKVGLICYSVGMVPASLKNALKCQIPSGMVIKEEKPALYAA
jgi:putative transposase